MHNPSDTGGDLAIPAAGAARFWFIVRAVNVRLRFIFLMVATALIVGYWDHIRNHVDAWTRPALAPDVVGTSDIEYYCPMHPSVVRGEPGKCPICNMPLSKRKKGVQETLPPGVLSRIQLSPHRVRLSGVETVAVLPRVLIKEIRNVGFVEYDERRLARISTRFPGRIEKLFVDFTGTTVKAGDPLVAIYSPELLVSQQELLLASRRTRESGGAPGGGASPEVAPRSMVDAARSRLDLWGLSRAQIDRIIQDDQVRTTLEVLSPIGGTVVEKSVLEGQYVQEGTQVYTVADLSSVWLYVPVYEDEIEWIRLGQPVEVLPTAFPGEIFVGTVSFIDPVLDRGTRSVRVRLEIPNPDGRLRPGMYATATIRVPLGRVVDGTAPRPAGERTVYACPMHPEVTADGPGSCPKCGMELEEQVVPDDPEIATVCSLHPDTPMLPGKGCARCREIGRVSNRAAGEPEDLTGYCCPVHPRDLREAPGACNRCNTVCEMVTIRKVLAIPESAVIDTGVRKVAYVERAPGLYEGVEVALGPRADGYFPVLSGLEPREKVVAAGAFLVDAESRLNPAAAAAYFGAAGGPSRSAEPAAVRAREPPSGASPAGDGPVAGGHARPDPVPEDLEERRRAPAPDGDGGKAAGSAGSGHDHDH